MIALMIIACVLIILALAAGAYRLAMWRGWEGHPRAGRVHHPRYQPGYELSSYENAIRAMRFMRDHPADES